MKIRNIIRTAAAASTFAILGAMAFAASGAAAMSIPDYQAALVGAGYTVKMDPIFKTHAGLKGSGAIIQIEKGGKGAMVEFFDYAGSRDALKADWTAVDGAGPRPRVATSDFDGRVLYWNEDSVLAVDFRDPNYREAAQVAADVFLGRRGTGGATTAPASGVSGTKLPATGTGGSGAEMDLGDLLLPVALLGAGGVMVAGCLGGVVRRRRR